MYGFNTHDFINDSNSFLEIKVLHLINNEFLIPVDKNKIGSFHKVIGFLPIPENESHVPSLLFESHHAHEAKVQSNIAAHFPYFQGV